MSQVDAHIAAKPRRDKTGQELGRKGGEEEQGGTLPVHIKEEITEDSTGWRSKGGDR